MKLDQLVAIASKGYPEDSLVEALSCIKRREHFRADLLAQFIVTELSETFSSSDSDEEQRNEAIRVLEIAQKELSTVIEALEVQ